MSGIDLLSLPPGAPSPLIGNEEVPVYVNDTVQTTTTQNIANVPLPVYEITSGTSFAAPVGGGTIVVRKPVGSATYITLQPEATGVYYCIKDGKGDAATNNIVINTAVGTIDGLNAYIINWPFGAIDLQFDGAQWNALSNMSSGGGGGVDSFNNRTGNITLTTADVTGVGGATTAYVTNALGSYLPLAGGNLTGNLGVGGSATVSGNLTVTGTAFASTPAPGDDTNKLATTAFVTNAVVASTTGVSSFNGRTGAVTLTPGDISSAGGATQAALSNYLPLAGGAIVGPVTAPTPATTDNSTNVATTAYVRSVATSVTANYLPLTGGTLSGALTVTVPGGPSAVNLNGASGTDRDINMQTNGVMRWRVTANMNAETGSNTGSDFGIYGFNDGGTLVDSFIITRATGNAALNGNFSCNAIAANGAITTSGSNAGVSYNSRNGSGNQYVIYNLDGNMLRFWQSSTGDMVTFSAGQCFFNEGITVANAPQIHMTPSVGAGGYGAMWHNDGSNTYLLLTNNNDAQGGWNGLRPFTVNDSSGGVTMSQGANIQGGLTASNIVTQYGVVYSGYAGNVISFRWTGVLQIFIDGNYNGDIATSGTLGNYLPLSGGTLTGALTVNNGRTTVNAGATINGGCTVSGNGIQYISMANNNMALKWVGNATQIIVDGTYQGTINTSSDVRTKSRRAAPEVDALADILKIGLESFDQVFLPGGATFHSPIGMIAQQLQQIGADLVNEGVNHDKNGNPTTETRLSVDLLPLLARLVGAVQQLTARVEELEAKAV